MKETRSTEWKKAVSNSFLKTVSAFANFNGGSIVFGVADDGSVEGLDDLASSCLAIENKINDSISPKPLFALKTNESDKTVTLTVEDSPDKPYLYKGKAYRRSDTADIEVDALELRRLVLAGQNLRFEDLPSSKNDLTFTALEKKLVSEHVVDSLNNDVLRTLNLLDPSTGFNNAALIVSDQNSFPGIDIAKFGSTIDIIADRVLFEGLSAIRQFELACEMFERYYSVEIIEGATRAKHRTVPFEAFREAVANAIAHRTWDVGARIRIAMHPDRIEVTSPGGLPSGLSEGEYLKGFVSELRNPILAGVLFRLNIIEMFGTGITRIRNAYAEFEQKPFFEVSANAIRVTLPVINKKRALSADETVVYEFLKTTVPVSSSTISKEVGFGKDKTIGILKSLVEKRYIEKTGAGRGTRYQA
jgi:ATP-dependent DNA helicase RecG